MPTKAFAAQSATSPLAPFSMTRREPLPSDVEIDILFCGVCHSDLHFARNETHFAAMLRAAWRVLRPGGLFFARLASTIGIEGRVEAIGGGRYHLPDGSDRYLVDAAGLLDWTRRLGGELVDPLKTTLVHEQRSMTTWVMHRR